MKFFRSEHSKTKWDPRLRGDDGRSLKAKTKLKVLPLSVSAVALLAACAVGPDYEKPDVSIPAAFKEAGQTTGDWKPSEPQDATDRGAWWSIYNDPDLDDLERRIDISNQNLKQAEAAYRAAVALADQTRSSLFPTVSAGPSVTRTGTGKHTAANRFDLSAGAAWTLDVWGRVRRAVEADEANAEASAADLANIRLSAQAELATDYFALRAQDELQRLLDATVARDEEILKIVTNQFNAGVAAQADVLAAQTNLENDRANAIGAGIKRAQLEHAIAVLIGKTPLDFSVTASDKVGSVPHIPTQVPSALLERRPDIASAERQMAAANAEIGYAMGAYFPTISLSASYGFASTVLDNLVRAGNLAWALGGSASETLLDFGARSGATEEARAAYDRSVAFYRQTVLTAFQNVEDNLAAQRILAEQEKAQRIATESARKSEAVTANQYREGIVPYNTLLSAQITRLNSERILLTVLSDRLAASVALIQALGGGWSTAQMAK